MVEIVLHKCENFLKVHGVYKNDDGIIVDLFRKYTIV